VFSPSFPAALSSLLPPRQRTSNNHPCRALQATDRGHGHGHGSGKPLRSIAFHFHVPSWPFFVPHVAPPVVCILPPSRPSCPSAARPIPHHVTRQTSDASYSVDDLIIMPVSTPRTDGGESFRPRQALASDLSNRQPRLPSAIPYRVPCTTCRFRVDTSPALPLTTRLLRLNSLGRISEIAVPLRDRDHAKVTSDQQNSRSTCIMHSASVKGCRSKHLIPACDLHMAV
jgi:hypothetical protein